MRYSLKKYREYECNKDIKIILFIYVFELTLIKDVKKKMKVYKLINLIACI